MKSDDALVQKLILSLHPLERKLLPFLKTGRSVEDLILASKMSEVEIVRAIQWLSNKNIVTIATTEQEIIGLDENGEKYAKKTDEYGSACQAIRLRYQ